MALENGTPEMDLNSLFGATPEENFSDLPELPDAVWARIVANAMDPDAPAAPETLLPDESAVPGEDDPDLLYLDGADADPDSSYDDGLIDVPADSDTADGTDGVDDGGAGLDADAGDPDGAPDNFGLGSGDSFDDFGSNWGSADPLADSLSDPLGADPLTDSQPWADPDPLDDGDSTDF